MLVELDGFYLFFIYISVFKNFPLFAWSRAEKEKTMGACAEVGDPREEMERMDSTVFLFLFLSKHEAWQFSGRLRGGSSSSSSA